MKTKKYLSLVLLLLVASVLFVGCADTQAYQLIGEGHTYGFWGGLWHGMIAPFDFIGSLIWDDVTVYAPNNNGGWYAFGFILGIGGLSGGFTCVSRR